VGVRIDDLTVSPFYRTAALRLDQTVSGLAGDLISVEIGRTTLDPRLLEVANLAHLALIAPAVALASRDPDARLVVLVDALDEIADHIGFDGLLSWLESGLQLPANVRFVLTSRAHSKLELLRRRRVGEVVELAIDAAAPEVRADLMAYAGRLVGGDAVSAAIRAQGAVPEYVAEEATDRAEGNFAAAPELVALCGRDLATDLIAAMTGPAPSAPRPSVLSPRYRSPRCPPPHHRIKATAGPATRSNAHWLSCRLITAYLGPPGLSGMTSPIR
jgi:hypothetical protein